MHSTTSSLTRRERVKSIAVRLGLGRDDYRVEPGLYGVNDPAGTDPVLVSANYKLSFDMLRSSLAGVSAWIIVLDTRGINVWCAAGKGTFGTEELIHRINATEIAHHVAHRRLVVPQLGAPGVAAHVVRERTGFRVVYGPVDARDLPDFLSAGMSATEEMRTRRFHLADRMVLVPLEVAQSWLVFLAFMAISVGLTWILQGFGAIRFWTDVAPSVLAVVAGAVLTPVMLPLLPGRAFALKGAFAGLALTVPWALLVGPDLPRLILGAAGGVSVASFLAMHFTGASTYTSLSGVRREMSIAVPIQVGVAAVGFVGRIAIGLMQ